MNPAMMMRGNLWLVMAVAIVAALLVLSVAYLVATQLGLMHVITMMLQAPTQMVTQCPGGTMIC
jgi:hypothetical protein